MIIIHLIKAFYTTTVMTLKNLSIHIVGDVLTTPFARLQQDIPEHAVTWHHHDIDQHFQVLLSNDAPDVLIVHTSPRFFFDGRNDTAAIEHARIFIDAVTRFAAQGETLIVLNTIWPTASRLVGMDAFAHNHAVATINDCLVDCAKKNALVSVLDAARLLANVGIKQAINCQNDLVMRMPYTGHGLLPLTKGYGTLLRERLMPRKKAILVDADNTLWSGIIGEDGIDGIELGPHFPGIVHDMFQRQLKALRESGIVLGLVSKNNEADVVELFAKRSMPLSLDDFTVRRINWQPKSENIASIAQELNIGADAMIFIDDNAFEVEEVQHALPMVDAYLFNARAPADALALLENARDLSAWTITADDKNKAQQYSDETKRKTLRETSGSLNDYLTSLDIKIEVGRNRSTQIKRIAQLTNKTNQFNLTTQRYSEADIHTLMERGTVYDFRVIDRFGDMGIVGVVIVANNVIDTFLMSCRALGRHIEGHMLRYVFHDNGKKPLRAHFIPSAKNAMVATFYEDQGFVLTSETASDKSYHANVLPTLDASIPMIEV